MKYLSMDKEESVTIIPLKYSTETELMGLLGMSLKMV